MDEQNTPVTDVTETPIVDTPVVDATVVPAEPIAEVVEPTAEVIPEETPVEVPAELRQPEETQSDYNLRVPVQEQGVLPPVEFTYLGTPR